MSDGSRNRLPMSVATSLLRTPHANVAITRNSTRAAIAHPLASAPRGDA